jgi:hypothetical protein
MFALRSPLHLQHSHLSTRVGFRDRSVSTPLKPTLYLNYLQSTRTDTDVAPLWDPVGRVFVGMITVSDYIQTLRIWKARVMSTNDLTTLSIAQVDKNEMYLTSLLIIIFQYSYRYCGVCEGIASIQSRLHFAPSSQCPRRVYIHAYFRDCLRTQSDVQFFYSIPSRPIA